ncbi:MAG: Uma2 family endonuclease [Labilithrix sp.]|nr:Uma2 family endonuclease [Labilithrix sp.]MCW5813213.1 Uma2 family endonuclease [Labilithrix sp.]
MQSAPKLELSYAEYARREGTSETKHEFFDGEIFAMSGGSIAHGRLGTRVRDAIKGSLSSGRDCVVEGPDIRVRTPSGKGTYPDGFVVCGKLETDAEDPESVTNPILLVEVLSESTEAYDRGKKFDHYRSLTSLKEYVLVSHQDPLIESHVRNPDGTWTTTYAARGETLVLRSVDARLEVDSIYEGMTHVDGVMRLT